METKESYKLYNADIVSTYVVRPVASPEESILILPYARRFQVNPLEEIGILQLSGFQSSFYEWYEKLEKDREIFMDNVRSGKDTSRNDVLLPFLKNKLTNMPSNAGVFDIGCGNGEAVLSYLADDVNYVGFDSSVKSLDSLISKFKKGKSIKNIRNVWRTKKGALRVATLGALPASLNLPENVPRSDYTIASMVLHHIPNYEIRQAINSLAQITNKNGRALIVTFDSDKREYIESNFGKIVQKEESFTRGEYHLPKSTLPDEYVYFHANKNTLDSLKADFGNVTSYTLGDFFRVFEARKVRK